MDREFYMKEALLLAEEALKDGDVPVGCVITDSMGRIIGRGRNRREAGKDATAHAEVEAIREACEAVGDWRLDSCTLYVTLEPCPMCAGAIINSRIHTVVFGTRDSVSGACGSVIDIFSERFGHSPAVFPGIMESNCSKLLKEFFIGLRERLASF